MVEIIRKDKKWYAYGLNYLAFYYWFSGQFEKSFNLIFEAIRVTENKDDQNHAWSLYSLGVFYFDTKDFDAASDAFEKSIELNKKRAAIAPLFSIDFVRQF